MTAIAESVLFQINSSNYTSDIFTIYKPQAGCSGFITTLRLTVDIKSIDAANFPYIPDDTPANVLQEILNEVALNTPFKEVVLFYKKGNGAWVKRAPIQIFNKEPYYDVNLMRYFSDANTIDVSEDLSLGIQIKPGNVLAPADTILVWGTAVEEKKNNGNEELAAAIEALQLAVYGRLTDLPSGTLLGRNTGTGTVEAISQSQFLSTASLELKADLVGGKIPAAQLPAFVDDVLEFATLAGFPATGETGKLYVAINTNLVYRWTGSIYVAISNSLALGISSSSAYRGDLGNTAYNHSQTIGNPHGLTKVDIGLSLTDNTPDAAKPISTAQQTALNLKADLVDGIIPAAQLPAFVDDVLEFATLAGFPTTGETGKLYVAINTNLVYRWTGSIYVAISDSLALGVTSSSAYRGDLGNTAYNHSQQSSGNPHNVTKTEVGLPALINALQLVASNNLSDLTDKQAARNNLAGAVTANRFLGGNGANVVLRSVDLATGDVTGILPPANGGSGIATAYTFRAAASVVQAIPNATATKIVLNSEINDSNNQYNPSLSRLTAVTTETWRLVVYITFNCASATRILLYVFKNGLEVPAQSRICDVPSNAGFFALSIPILEFPLLAGDYLEVFAYCSPSANTSADANLTSVFWSGKRIA